ncbi:tetratricopeptide repeat protein [Roseimicrobium gellanilyticum]|uniref:Tetratricopeptide repeat protein n=1 Tax=Roseimicrobium gellanilyticum TaxID=748857 RepID=A0A366HUI1_9BACT|nr:tetratricopeptide repeat protein [Roseimicrobium gellanilyticum]RBP46564.1 tetratricopeptide repeat protein [Roseimicrobium gellanilyticum]
MRRNPPGGSVIPRIRQQLVFLLLVLALDSSEALRAQDPQQQPPAAPTAPSAEALKYHEMLRRRPQTGVIFDRFTSAWLATGSRDSLKDFLKKKTELADATAADHLILALVYSATGEDTEALKASERATTKAPDDALLHLRTAEIASRLRQWDTALAALTRAAQIGLTEESDIRATRLHADILWRLGRPGEAKQIFRKLIDRHPEEHSLREELVDMLVENGLKPEAAEESRTLVDLTKDPFDKAMRRLRLADLLVDLRKTPLARTELDLSLAQSGMDSWLEGESLDRMERLFRRGGDLNGFASKLRELAMQHPTRVSIVRRQMRILTELARPVDAAALAVDLLKRTPGRRDIREDYITLLEAQGKIPDAIQQMEELLRQEPKDGEIMLRLAGLHGRNNAPERTRELLDAFLKQSPNDEGALMQAGRLLERLSLDTAARDVYEKWTFEHPLDPLAGLSLAALLHRQGDTEGAIKLWRLQGGQGDITTASQVATAASSRGEVVVAFEILKAREKELQDDPRLLMQVCLLAMQARREADCVHWLRRYAQLVKQTGELQHLSTLASSVLNRKSTRQQLLEDFAKSPPAGTGESILLALTNEYTTPENTYDEQLAGRRKADELLTLAWAALPHPAGTPLNEDENMVEAARLQVLSRRRDWTAMLQVLKETIARPNAKTSTRLQALADASASALNYEEALRWVAEWKAVAPTSHIPWRVHAGLLRSTGKTEEMIAVLREAAQRFQDQDEMSFDLAAALQGAGQGTEALAVYRRLFEQKEDANVRLRIGSQMIRTAKGSAQLEDLITEWKRYQREQPDSPEPWRLLAMAHREKPDVEAHCNALGEALRLAPNDIALMRDLAQSEDARGNAEKAGELYRQAARKESTPQAQRAYAEFLLKRGESQEALQIMQEIVAAQATTLTEIEELADNLMAMRLWREAAVLLDVPSKSHAQNVRLQYQRGVALEESGKLDEATQHFIRILQCQEELVDAIPLPPLQEEIAVPEAPGALWWHRLLEHGRTAYHYNGMEQRGVHLPMGARPGPVRTIFLPQCLEEAQVFALRHLVRLAEVGRAQSPPLPPILLPESLPMAKIWPNVIMRNVWGRGQMIVTAEQMRAHPLLQVGWMHGTVRILDLAESDAAALLLHVEKTFASTHPELAAEAAILQAHSDTSDAANAPLDRALAHAKLSTHSKERLAESIASWIVDDPVLINVGIRQRTKLSEQGEEKLLAALTAWAKEAATEAKPAGILTQATRSLSARGRWEAWRDLLDEVVPRIRENSAALAEQAKVREVGSYFQLLAFPPYIHSGYGISPLLCLHQGMGWRGRTTPDRAPAALAAEARDPLTKLLCLQAAGLPAELKQEAIRLAAAHPTRDDVLFLKASVLAKDGESEELTNALREWVTLPVSAEVSRSRARYVVEFAVEGNLTADDATQTAVLNAAKHLVTLGIVEERRSRSLVEDLKAAGFDAPSQMLAGVLTKGNRPSPTASNPLLGAFTIRTAQDLMKRVDGTSDGGMALRLITETLAKFASDEIGAARGYMQASSDDGWQWLMQALHKKDTFRESVLSHLLSEAGTPRLDYAEAAFIIDRLGYSSKHAKENYLKALEENPADTRVRLKLVCLLVDDQPAEAQKIYQAAPADDRLFIGTVLCDYTNRNNLMLTQLVSKFASGVLQDTASRKVAPLDLDWLNFLTSNLTWTNLTSSWSGISDLLRAEPAGADAGFGSAPAHELADSLNTYELTGELEALCEAAMELPDLATSAFACYAGLKLKKGASVDLLVPKARDAMRTSAAAERWLSRTELSHNMVFEPAHIWQPSPLALLALHASRQPDTKEAFKELTTLAQSCKVPDGDRIVALLERLYTCPENEFPAAARELSTLPPTAAQQLDYVPAATVARVWKERGLSLDPFVLLSTESDAAITYPPYASGHCMALQTLSRRGHREEAKAFLAKVMEEYLGPRAGWKERVKDIGDDFRDPRLSSLNFIHGVMQNISQSDPALSFVSLELAEEAGLRLHRSFRTEYFVPAWMTRANDSGMPGPRTAAIVLNFLAGSPWLKPDAPLWDCAMRSKEEGTLLTMTAAAIKGLSKEQQAHVRATLEHAALKNPGAAILDALVQTDQQKLVDAIVLANGSIKNAPAHSLEALGVVMENELAPIQRSTAKARAPEIHSLLQKLEDTEAARNAEAFFTASSIESLHLSDSQFEETMRRAATQLAATDHAKAVKLLDRACELIVQKQQRGAWNGSGGSNGWTACGQALNLWCDKTQSLDVVTVACDLFHQPDEFNAVSAGWWHCPSWGNALLATWKDEGGLGDAAAGLRGLLQSLHSKLAIKKAPLLIPAFMDFHLKLDVWQRQEVLRAADALAMKNSDISGYAAWVGLAFRLNDLADGALWLPGSQDPERIKNLMEGFRAVIKDQSVNPLVRLAAAHVLMNKAGKHADPETIWAAMDLATLVLEKEWPAHGYLMLYILNTVNRLPVDDRFKTAAARWLPAWLRRNQYTGTSSSQGLSYDPVDEYQSAVLTLAARGLDDMGVRQTLQSLSGLQQRSATNLLTLIRNDRHEVAKEFFMRNKDQLLRASHNNVQPEDKDMPKLRAFAEMLPHPDQKLQVMVYCSSFYGFGMLRDQWADSRALPWNRRMAEQAREVMQHVFKDPTLKEKLMIELADAPGAVAEMAQELREKDLRDMVRTSSFGSGSVPISDSLRYPMELALLSLAERIRQTSPADFAIAGTVFPGPLPQPANGAQLEFQTLLERVDSGRDSQSKAECMRQIEGNLFEATMLAAPSMEGTLLAGFIPAWSKILRAYSDEKERFDEEALGVATQIVLAGLSGKGGELAAWREDVPHYRRDSLKAQFLAKRHLMPVAQQLCRTHDGKWRNFEERWKLVQSFAADPWVQEYLKSSRDTISQLVRNRVLTIEEAIERADELAKLFPKDGRAAAELAAIMKAHGRDDVIPGLLALAMEQAKGSDAWYAEWGFRLVQWRAEHQQRSDAVKLWEEIKGRAKQPALKKAVEAGRPEA